MYLHLKYERILEKKPAVKSNRPSASLSWKENCHSAVYEFDTRTEMKPRRETIVGGRIARQARICFDISAWHSSVVANSSMQAFRGKSERPSLHRYSDRKDQIPFGSVHKNSSHSTQDPQRTGSYRQSCVQRFCFLSQSFPTSDLFASDHGQERDIRCLAIEFRSERTAHAPSETRIGVATTQPSHQSRPKPPHL
mmetsp:Transcript_21600/g.47843  ORF Transcript_21600/g.47843 Transcript_21600/m.47843 type:complete len:195 (+) Transcript_21600:60-644(+)